MSQSIPPFYGIFSGVLLPLAHPHHRISLSQGNRVTRSFALIDTSRKFRVKVFYDGLNQNRPEGEELCGCANLTAMDDDRWVMW